jgi:outer membrane cobalamin receptor
MLLRGLALFLIPAFSFAQSIDSQAPASPTQFSSDFTVDSARDLSQSLQVSSGAYLKDYGGSGKAQTFSLRGQSAADTSMLLEGIRLNSPASGDFDFGSLSSFGLGASQISRGSGLGSEVNFRLPDSETSKALLSYGSYQSLGFGLLTRGVSFSLDQSENDFPFSDQGIDGRRSHNFSQRLNFRAWKRARDYQVWTQMLYLDQELPGPASTPSLAASQSLTPTLVYQGKWKNFEWAFFGTYQRQTYANEAKTSDQLNQWFSVGFRDQGRFELHPHFQLETAVEWTQDKVFSNDRLSHFEFSSPLRQSFSLSTTGYADLSSHWLLRPSLRGEFLSDLNSEHFSIQPSLGTRYRMSDEVDLLANINWVSRAPNFNEMYFEIPNLSLRNLQLKRQHSLLGDLGYELHFKLPLEIGLHLQQALFVNRTEDLIQNRELHSNGLLQYQSQNTGTLFAYGLETYGNIQLKRLFRLAVNYTYQDSEVSEQRASYQPTHRLNLVPTFFPEEWLSFSIPFYMRTFVASSSTTSIPAQFVLDLIFKAQIQKFTYQLQFTNLLARQRSEIYGYPLSNETSARLSVMAEF